MHVTKSLLGSLKMHDGTCIDEGHDTLIGCQNQNQNAKDSVETGQKLWQMNNRRSTARLRVALLVVAIILAFGLLFLCLDIRAMLIKEAHKVNDIKIMVQNMYDIASRLEQSQDENFVLADKRLDNDDDFVSSKNSDFDYILRNMQLESGSQLDSDINLEIRDLDVFEAEEEDVNNDGGEWQLEAPDDNSKQLKGDQRQCDLIPDSWKFDCHPEPYANAESCEQRSCCWQELTSNGLNPSSNDVPFCFYPSDYASYTIANITETVTGFQLFLIRNGKSYYPDDVPLLKVDLMFETQYRLHIKITDAVNKRYEVPVPVMPSVTNAAEKTDYEINFQSPSGLQVRRKATGAILFDTSVGALIYANQFLQLSAQLPSTYIYGLGEQRDSFVRSFDWKKIVLMNADHVPQENVNLYGSHPFYLMMEESQHSHGVLLFNSNPMEVILQPLPAITYRTLGGVLDFYFFLGPSPSDVISQYSELIGRPFMPPYWSLGFHLCRFGYETVDKARAVWQRTRDAGIPFDVQWTDIDYMFKRRDFTVDQESFGDLSGLVTSIHDADMHYVPIVDCAISTTKNVGEYPPYDDGIKMDIFIKDDRGDVFVGKVWPGESVWPDFTNLNATMYWTTQFQKFHDIVPFDGAWIDMNEPSNFITGSINGCPNSTWDNPPYTIGVTGGKLAYLTVCMSAQQAASRHYDVHNLYGFTETIATNFALTTVRPNKRPFVISRSSFPGSGYYGGVWTGDVSSAWHDMRRSVSDILNFNMFGIPLVGADICGFNGNTTTKLCQRWMELGAFYPFSRNHNEDTTIDQDPVALGADVVTASLNALHLRYKLLPYLYTLFSRAHQFGETVARPLFFEFPNDRLTYTIDSQFLWGSHLMVLPVLEEDVVTITPYFPQGLWYLLPSSETINSTGSDHSVDAPLDTIVVALRGGAIIPTQGVNRTTTASRYEMFGLWVALCSEGKAMGEVYWDDGDSLDVHETGIYNHILFSAEENTIVTTVDHFEYHGENSMTLNNVLVYGVQSTPSVVTVNTTNHPFIYNNHTKILQIDQLQIKLESPFTIAWK